MNIYNITSKNEKKETIHKNDLKIVAAKKIHKKQTTSRFYCRILRTSPEKASHQSGSSQLLDTKTNVHNGDLHFHDE